MGSAPLKVAFAAKDLAITRLSPYAKALASPDPGLLSASGNADGAALGTLVVVGRATLLPGASSQMVSADGTYRLVSDWPSGALAITETHLSVGNLPLDVDGRIDGLRKPKEGEPRVELRVRTPGEVEVDDVAGLPGIAGKLPDDVKLAGRLRLEAKIDRTVGRPRHAGLRRCGSHLRRRRREGRCSKPLRRARR